MKKVTSTSPFPEPGIMTYSGEGSSSSQIVFAPLKTDWRVDTVPRVKLIDTLQDISAEGWQILSVTRAASVQPGMTPLSQDYWMWDIIASRNVAVDSVSAEG